LNESALTRGAFCQAIRYALIDDAFTLPDTISVHGLMTAILPFATVSYRVHRRGRDPLRRLLVCADQIGLHTKERIRSCGKDMNIRITTIGSLRFGDAACLTSLCRGPTASGARCAD